MDKKLNNAKEGMDGRGIGLYGYYRNMKVEKMQTIETDKESLWNKHNPTHGCKPEPEKGRIEIN